MQQQQGLAAALALCVPTGLYCAVAFAKKMKEAAAYKQELEEIKAKYKQDVAYNAVEELEENKAKYKREVADMPKNQEHLKTAHQVALKEISVETQRQLQTAQDQLKTAQVEVATLRGRDIDTQNQLRTAQEKLRIAQEKLREQVLSINSSEALQREIDELNSQIVTLTNEKYTRQRAHREALQGMADQMERNRQLYLTGTRSSAK